ncbi:acyl-CoA dehydrogenase family protein [Streptomyces sp. WI04-05B]|uniref:acyl-CoA dehydrogenase family protein n=1 Tax=Streptomyces TaxID=1883 RepID=UPI0029A25974|nr:MULTISPECIES: acyl-CoA dehydrogenase family protein [unclassified Streptomyces]MDX2545023.1 acyl-CoA/acyl-ACP dehydrogenase [Streptomyces sp. WI04-05B]MDX2587514.1 acyl-CoA/acyl-ACP dehydrogenase [Streptomyces sp. WI04-05A]MDX3748306.1 acyl-CoA/acyl-ACP dehydrogenase [Streptomyces sp. AK08-02]
MNFELSEEQGMLRGASRDLLADRAPIEHVRAWLDRDEDVDPEVWRLTAELGWPGLGLSEEYGGSGQGLVELALVAEEFGGALGRGPFVPTAIVGRALAIGGSPGLRSEVLPGLAAGSSWATWAFAESRAPWSLDGIRATARVDGDAFVLDGVKTAVQDAGGARWLLLTALHDGVPASFLVDREAPGITVRRQRTLDPTRAFHEVRVDGVRVPADRRLTSGPDEIQRLLDEASVLRCADALGVMRRLLELTVEHTTTRVQFGQPIGGFQAVKHSAADMALLVHGARAATHYAAMATDAGTADAARAACAAASYVSAGAGEVAARALQLHGGIGFTWEHDLHLYLRRARADSVLYGDAAVHRDRLVTLLRPSRAIATTSASASGRA